MMPFFCVGASHDIKIDSPVNAAALQFAGASGTSSSVVQ
jgi:hypothetical protein